MQLLGICFAGTSTAQRLVMTQFMGRVLGLPQSRVDGVEADLFRFPDGSSFAVASPGGMGESERSIGFLVANLDEALAEFDAAGITTDAPASNARERYVHFTAPDGHLYELVERRQQPAEPEATGSNTADVFT
jgi:catechol 2,3-dioxygenase-like lactoylglutathione lyase family enzyme